MPSPIGEATYVQEACSHDLTYEGVGYPGSWTLLD
ncbi:hypothetical protein C6341_g6204 [Phytophthora cactorum]|nr:hypothetical protein PC120_g4496 [Phytophthora cactorum]KAG3181931.1 hypothetical protein C6341_g6204 [Phytophthora cactorum]